MLYSESEIRRVAHVGFQIAMKRGKENVLGRQGQRAQIPACCWREIVTEVGKEYPAVELSHMYVDNAGDAAGARAEAV